MTALPQFVQCGHEPLHWVTDQRDHEAPLRAVLRLCDVLISPKSFTLKGNVVLARCPLVLHGYLYRCTTTFEDVHERHVPAVPFVAQPWPGLGQFRF
eukprot:CAMPEP_0185498348 /NCGR_PEP_ID=MMETSP1366-20130426/19616_1 /TAXON_ID=38817 /ORGANISM="Gephyrocapsa oceanica, Strain RCC1303" /LENGTH=96 /DNA_ID=CAMNT_0028107511 /DNA_START=902 /DNA_END=1192 /DNA_ORIENTATION=+